uniref:Uncharacterized protein n=1 Tax=Ditylenchus dipsaci TaxID=166011 RepID=A0A915DAR5_9BILA
MKPEDKENGFLDRPRLLRKGSVKQSAAVQRQEAVEGSSRKPVFKSIESKYCCIHPERVMQLKKDTKESRHSIELVVGKEEDIFWTPAKEFLKSECEKKRIHLSRVSSIIHGCIGCVFWLRRLHLCDFFRYSLSFVPMCIRKSPEKVSLQASRRRSNWCSPSSKLSVASQRRELSNKDRTRCRFMIFYFIEFLLYSISLRKAGILLEKEKFLPDEVAEIVRVAYGHTDLLCEKRMAQSRKQLEVICRKQQIRFFSAPGIKLNPENDEREKQRKAAWKRTKEMDEKRRAMIQAKKN